MSHTKRSHFVPRVYLRAWAEGSRVVVRRRGRPHCFASHIDNVAVRNYLYGIGEIGQQRERMFGDLEGEWADLRAALLSDGGLINANARHKVSIFIALQYIRTDNHGAQMRFVRDFAAYSSARPVSREDMRDFLLKKILHFPPADREVEGAWTIACVGLNNGSPPSVDEEMRVLFDIAVRRIAPLLGEYSWSVEHCSKPILLTSDRPVMTWRPRSPRDQFEGVGLATADEIRFPLTPSDLLIIRRAGYQEGVRTVQTKRFRRVNADIASQCQDQIIGAIASRVEMEALPLADWRPSIRFNVGPGWQIADDGTEENIGDVVHMWSPNHV